MPRLSIVIPYRRDEDQLEATILSVLEQRPADSEIIVVHDGSYRDRFELQDEILFIELDDCDNVVELINAGIMAACAPVLNVLIDGLVVQPCWTDGPVDMIETDPELAAVAVGIHDSSSEPSFGISRSSISQPSIGSIECSFGNRNSEEISPRLECGFFRRKTLLALGGFNDRLGLVGAAIDFAWALDALGQDSDCDDRVCLTAASLVSQLDASELESLANLSVEYGISKGGMTAALVSLMKGALQGQLRLAIPWSRGLRTGPKHSLAVRLAIAKEQLAEGQLTEEPNLKVYEAEHVPMRRAA